MKLTCDLALTTALLRKAGQAFARPGATIADGLSVKTMADLPQQLWIPLKRNP